MPLPATLHDDWSRLGPRSLHRKRAFPGGPDWSWDNGWPAWRIGATKRLWNQALFLAHHLAHHAEHILDRDARAPASSRMLALRTDAVWHTGALLRFSAATPGNDGLVLLALAAPAIASAHQRLAALAQVPKFAWRGQIPGELFDPEILPRLRRRNGSGMQIFY